MLMQVAWLDHHSIPLTYEERRVVDDSRFSVVRPYVKEWNLYSPVLPDSSRFSTTVVAEWEP